MTALTPLASIDVDGPVKDVDSLLTAFLLGYGESSRRAYAADLRAWLQWLVDHDVNPLGVHRSHVELYRHDLEQQGMKGSTIARKLAVLSGMYRYAESEGLIVRNPVELVRRPRLSRNASPTEGLDRDELKRLLAVAVKPREKALVSLLIFNGLRISEALACDVVDLSTENGHRTLSITRKGDMKARVAIAPPVGRALDAMLSERGHMESAVSIPLFVTSSGARWDRVGAWRVIKRLARQAEITKTISPHSLRHSYVTLALETGVPIHRVQESAGHADPKTTIAYNRRRLSLDEDPTYAVAAALS